MKSPYLDVLYLMSVLHAAYPWLPRLIFLFIKFVNCNLMKIKFYFILFILGHTSTSIAKFTNIKVDFKANFATYNNCVSIRMSKNHFFQI